MSSGIPANDPLVDPRGFCTSKWVIFLDRLSLSSSENISAVLALAQQALTEAAQAQASADTANSVNTTQNDDIEAIQQAILDLQTGKADQVDLDDLVARVALLELDNVTNKADINAIQAILAGLTDYQDQIDALNVILNGHELWLIDLQAAKVDHETRITTLETDVADHETRIDSLETVTIDHENRIDTLETSSADHETRIDDLETNDALQDTRLDDLEARLLAPIMKTVDVDLGVTPAADFTTSFTDADVTTTSLIMINYTDPFVAQAITAYATCTTDGTVDLKVVAASGALSGIKTFNYLISP